MMSLEEFVADLSSLDLELIKIEFAKKESKQFDNKDEFKTDEKIKLEKYSEKLAELTNANEHTLSFLLVSYIVGDERLIEIAKAIKLIKELDNHQLIHEYKHTVFTQLMEKGRKKFGAEDWNKYIYNNL